MVDFVDILLGRIRVKGEVCASHKHAKDIRLLKQDNTYKANGENFFLNINK